MSESKHNPAYRTNADDLSQELTKREAIAIAAYQALLAKLIPVLAAERAVEAADFLIEELNRVNE